MKPTHGLFSYFTALVESYSRVMAPKSEILQRFENFAEKQGRGLAECYKAGEQRQMYMEQQQRLADLEGAQNVYGGEMGEDSEMTEDVDWFDFVVVEQIELYDD